MIKLIH